MVKRWKIVDEKYAFTKTDNQRLGFLREAGYISIKDPYKSPLINEFKAPDKAENAKILGKKTMLPTGTFVRDETQGGYFQKTYLRSMEGEGLYDPISLVRQFRMKQKEKFLGGVFLPSVSVKQPCGIGSFCATINPSPPAFSPVTRTPKKQPKVKLNYACIPPKQGTGYGYAHISIGKDPPYMSEDFDRYSALCKKAQDKSNAKQMTSTFRLGTYPPSYFWKNPWLSDVPLGKAKRVPAPVKPLAGLWLYQSPAKWDGGMKAGTLSRYPEHSRDLQITCCIHPQKQTNKFLKVYLSPDEMKSTVQSSIMQKNVRKFVNQDNWKTKVMVMDYKCPAHPPVSCPSIGSGPAA